MEKTRLSGSRKPAVAGTEGGRRPTGVPATAERLVSSGEHGNSSLPDPEVPEKPVRRRFTAEYKLQILQEADRCSDTGQLGAVLRREGLYSSHLTTWRRQREEGMINGLGPKKRGRRANRRHPLVEENERLRHENERLGARLKQTETIIEFQKKLSDVLGIPVEKSSEKNE